MGYSGTRARVAYIGRFASTGNAMDGQVIKTRTIADALEDTGRWRVCRIDTDRNTPRVKVALSLIEGLVTCRLVIVSLSFNGKRALYPILALLSRLRVMRVCQAVIGGALDIQVVSNPNWVHYLNTFSENWVESPGLVEALECLGVTNARYVPNCKDVSPRLGRRARAGEKTLRLCTFSRVRADKGIGEAVWATKQLICRLGKGRASLHIYGPIDANYQRDFEAAIRDGSPAVEYRGVVDYMQSSSVLANYDVLLFPTVFEGEGLAGTLIDALSAGTPIVATSWRWNADVVVEGVTGFCYPADQPEVMVDILERIARGPSVLAEMTANCIEKSTEFAIGSVLATIEERLMLVSGAGR